MSFVHPCGDHRRIPQPKILLEGTHLTRKTDLAFALAEHPDIVGERKHRWHIPLISAEWETRSKAVPPTKSSPGVSMIDFDWGDIEWVNACYRNYLELLDLHRSYYWIIDRFHVSTIAHQMLTYGRRLDLTWVDSRLAELGFVLVHCWRHPATFERAREERLLYSENPDRYRDLGLFVEEQNVMRDIVSQSSLPTLTVDVSDDNIDECATAIIRSLQEMEAFWP